jgi:hypothetical protein
LSTRRVRNSISGGASSVRCSSTFATPGTCTDYRDQLT